MIWKYQALTKSGNTVLGVFEGSTSEVRCFLDKESLTILLLYPDLVSSVQGSIKKSLTKADMAVFFEDLADMVSSGMSLVDALFAVSQSVPSRWMEIMLRNVGQGLKAGDSLAVSLEKTHCFPKLVIACVECGERSGTLKDVLGFLAQYFRYRKQLEEQLATAFIYPVMVLMILLAIMVFVAVKVIPQLQPLLPPQALHQPATWLVLTLTHALCRYWFVLFVMIIGGLMCLTSFFKRRKMLAQQMLYQLPMLGGMFKESHLCLCLIHVSVLFKSGVPLIKALEQLHDAMPSLMTERLMACRSFMIGGSSFSVALGQDPFFPAPLTLGIRKAEQTVEWDSCFTHIIQYFDKRVKNKILIITQLIQPLLFCCCGFFLVMIGLAFLVPIYGSLSTIAGGN